LNKEQEQVPSLVSYATQLGVNLDTLQGERPSDWFQRQLAVLHYQRAQVFAEYQRLTREGLTFRAEIVVWQKYVSLTRAVCDLTGDLVPVGIVNREPERQRSIEEAVLNHLCDRCGFVWHRRQPRFVNGLCSSCIALQQKVLVARRSSCKPWGGRFAADDVTPLHANGHRVLPGVRNCGNSDCVNPKHIKRERKGNG